MAALEIFQIDVCVCFDDLFSEKRMSRKTIILLEDNADRIREFKSAVAQFGSEFRLQIWRDANRMIAECHEYLADARLISLDHDLNKESDDSPDPGDGLEVAKFLARLPCICPVILHTSNSERLWSMDNEFRFGKWQTEHVMPFGTDWIAKSWLPKARTLLYNSSDAKFFRPIKFPDHSERFNRTLLSLYGLALGDGIGEMMAVREERAHDKVMKDDLPPAPWWHTDDTEMAISIVEVLRLLGTTHQDTLARQFALRYERDPERGYGSGARLQLRLISDGAEWRVTSRDAFSARGSLGNGSAMRVAPLGAWFADDLDRAVQEARASAVITHMHAEGVAGAIAIAVATAMAWRLRGKPAQNIIEEFFEEIYKRVPDGETRRGIAHAIKVKDFDSPIATARLPGNGSMVTCPDTVPFCIWSAAKYFGKFRDAIANTASVGGDGDTNCAIVGGIVAQSAGWKALPLEWLEKMEKLPYKPIA